MSSVSTSPTSLRNSLVNKELTRRLSPRPTLQPVRSSSRRKGQGKGQKGAGDRSETKDRGGEVEGGEGCQAQGEPGRDVTLPSNEVVLIPHATEAYCPDPWLIQTETER